MFDEDLLDKISSELRGGIPDLKINKEGQMTVILNYGEVVKILNRDPNHVSKYISRELGAKSKVKAKQLQISKIVGKSTITNLLEAYATKFIFCPNCGKPDTLLVKNKKKFDLQCLSCGKTTKL